MPIAHASKLLIAGAILLSSTVFAAEPGGVQPGAQPGTMQPAAAGDRRLSELFYQLQVLQQEVQELRGMVEEQSHQLNRLARDQKEQYIDLDRRVAGLSAGGVAPVDATGGAQPGASSFPATGAGTGQTGAAVVPTPAAGGAAATVAASASERDAYQQAFDLMKARQFDQSIAAFNRLIVDYPNGQYAPNAFYWLGELHLAQQNTEQARQAFMQVISLYPDHPKVPDTLYKLGVAYHRLGDTDRALEYFNQVRSQYPQSSAAGLATSYAQEIR